MRIRHNNFLMTAAVFSVSYFTGAVGARADVYDTGYIRTSFTLTIAPPGVVENGQDIDVGASDTGFKTPEAYSLIQTPGVTGDVSADYRRSITNTFVTLWDVTCFAKVSGILQTGSVPASECDSSSNASANGVNATATGAVGFTSGPNAVLSYAPPASSGERQGNGSTVNGNVHVSAHAEFPNAYGYSQAGFDVNWSRTAPFDPIVLHSKSLMPRRVIARRVTRPLRNSKTRRVAALVAHAHTS